MTEPADAVGVVLAGGASRRFGSDKALAEIDGRSIAARTADLLATVCDEVLVADRERHLLDRRPSIADGPGAGPAAAILGARRARPGTRLLALACDLPAVPASLLRALLAVAEPDLVLPRWSGGWEPLVAVYGPGALAALEDRVEKGRLSLHGLFSVDGLVIHPLEGVELERHGDPAELFANLNTRQALADYLSRGRRS